jgi:hypothetical protein
MTSIHFKPFLPTYDFVCFQFNQCAHLYGGGRCDYGHWLIQNTLLSYHQISPSSDC